MDQDFESLKAAWIREINRGHFQLAEDLAERALALAEESGEVLSADSAQARRHGLKALDLGERFGEADTVKHALYLLGETASLRGDEEGALEYFERLRREFYPEADYLPRFLLAVDVRHMINLHA